MLHANRYHSCLRVLDWQKWDSDYKMLDLKQRLELHGYHRKCCRRMILTSIDTSEDTLGLLNAERALQRRVLTTPSQKQDMFKRWFPATFKERTVTKTNPAPPSLPTSTSTPSQTRPSIQRLHLCV